jgi:hypothetical protein
MQPASGAAGSQFLGFFLAGLAVWGFLGWLQGREAKRRKLGREEDTLSVGEAGGCGKEDVLMGVAGRRRDWGQEKKARRGKGAGASTLSSATLWLWLCTARSPAAAVLQL